MVPGHVLLKVSRLLLMVQEVYQKFHMTIISNSWILDNFIITDRLFTDLLTHELYLMILPMLLQ